MPGELDRLREAYDRRQADRRIRNRDDAGDPAHRFLLETRERDVLALLEQAGLVPAGLEVLDVGCGSGGWLAWLRERGGRPDALHGVEVLSARAEAARERNPGVDIRQGSAEALPFSDASMDLVSQFTVFSSILDQSVRRRVAAEMWRVVRPGGSVLWYDFLFNPMNRDTRGVSRAELRALFPAARAVIHRVTLAPPLARLLVPRWPAAARGLETLPFCRTHLLGLIGKEPSR